jgi:hypothetical protein
VPRTEAVAHAQREEAGMGKPACSTRSVSCSRGHARQANRPRQQEKKLPHTHTHASPHHATPRHALTRRHTTTHTERP